MDEQQGNTLIAGVHHSALKQTRAQATATHFLIDRDPKFGTGGPLGIDRKCQMGHGHNFQAPVENTIDVIPTKIEFFHVKVYLFVCGRVAKTQIPVVWIQAFQMRTDFGSVLDAQNAHRDPSHPAAPE
jgi:hypothetical protein